MLNIIQIKIVTKNIIFYDKIIQPIYNTNGNILITSNLSFFFFFKQIKMSRCWYNLK